MVMKHRHLLHEMGAAVTGFADSSYTNPLVPGDRRAPKRLEIWSFLL